MKLNIFIIALLLVHNLSAAQQKPNLKRAGSPIQNLDARPNTRTTTTTSSLQPVQSLDEEDTKMACEQQPSTRTIGTQTDMHIVGNQIVLHELDEFLIQAAQEGNLQQIQTLFDPRRRYIPDINARDTEPFDLEEETFRMNGMTPLMMAADQGDIEVTQFLIAQGVDLNLQTYGGELTALGIALKDMELKWDDYDGEQDDARTRRSKDESYPIAKMLIKAGADVNKAGWGSNPLESAVESGEEDIIKLLIAH